MQPGDFGPKLLITFGYLAIVKMSNQWFSGARIWGVKTLHCALINGVSRIEWPVGFYSCSSSRPAEGDRRDIEAGKFGS
jgi:hypothetical protein